MVLPRQLGGRVRRRRLISRAPARSLRIAAGVSRSGRARATHLPSSTQLPNRELPIQESDAAPPPSTGGDRPTRAGYVALVGRPNAGKSTLMNRLVGEHLSIVTPKAQTTWQRVTGLLTLGDAQLVFLDTPGLLEARDLLQRSMLAAALEAVHEADVVLVVADGAHAPGRDDRERLSGAIAAVVAPVHLAVNKVDVAGPQNVSAWRRWASSEAGVDRVHEISASTGHGLDDLREALIDALPEAPFLYPEDEVAAAPVRFFVGELVRETIFELYGEEIPYSTMCQVEEFREGEDPIYVQVNVFVERSSQKGILIGAGGEAIRRLGIDARAKIEHFLGARVYLDLWVKPLKAWRRKRAHLGKLGFRVPQEE